MQNTPDPATRIIFPVPSPSQSTPPVPSDNSSIERGPVEIGGPEGPEPTRFGDWEKNGRCIDF
jgi:hypothetical protein